MGCGKTTALRSRRMQPAMESSEDWLVYLLAYLENLDDRYFNKYHAWFSLRMLKGEAPKVHQKISMARALISEQMMNSLPAWKRA